MNKHKPTHYQQAIYDWAKNGTGNAIVVAVAGSGKTTTLKGLTEYISGRIIVLSFNKSIAEVLKDTMPSHVESSTIHSFGLKACRGRHFKVRTDKTKLIWEKEIGWTKLSVDECKAARKDLWTLIRIVSLFKNKGVADKNGLAPYPNKATILEWCEKYDIDCPDDERFFNTLENVYKAAIKDWSMLDFDDMLLFPVIYNLTLPTYDWLLVDESQDLNSLQIELLRRAGTGRVVFVGDPNQAIYGFRGADTEALKTVEKIFSTVSLPLSISWRCPKKGIARAKSIVPAIEAAPNAIEGIDREIDKNEFINIVKAGDFVLARTNAPLVAWCLWCIRNGKKAMVKGRDICEKLDRQLDMIAKDFSSGNLVTDITLWGEKKSEVMNSSRLINFNDEIDTLRILATECKSIAEIKAKIAIIFSDTCSGIVFSTIHKAKGLEAERVFLICPEKLPHPKATQAWARVQEDNLKYVACTRHLKEFYVVSGADTVGEVLVA